MSDKQQAIREIILQLVPGDGSTVGNQTLFAAIEDQLPGVSTDDYHQVRDELIDEGILAKGRGRGGSVYRADGAQEDDEDDDLGEADDEDGFELATQEAPVPSKKRNAKGSRKKRKASGGASVISYRHQDKRANNPEVGMVHPDNDPDAGTHKWTYDPHLDPALQFDVGRSQIEAIIDDALSSGDQEKMRDALRELKRLQEPYLTWTGKAERTSFEVDTVSLHVHERIDPASILSAVRKNARKDKTAQTYSFQPGLFDAPFENLPLRQALDFYKHEKDWSNRLIAGDSLLVMNSLLQKESMAGRVQMIYIDPPYGIKYGSNFQPFVNKRDVKDRKDEDLTQEPEMIKAFRDTWELGIHSYLTYLRDRLVLARELLSDTGSIFVQISDENEHLVRSCLDEIFGTRNFIAAIKFKKSTSTSSALLPTTNDLLLWFSKDRSSVKYRQIFTNKSNELASYVWCQSPDSRQVRKLTKAEQIDWDSVSDQLVFSAQNLRSQGVRTNTTGDFVCFGRSFYSGDNHNWKTHLAGLRRLEIADRLIVSGSLPNYKRFVADFPVYPVTDSWDDTAIAGFSGQDKVYVVQTAERVVERCILMTTDPGDLVVDPTCGSGTTAFGAEKWGRRWITCDTSRVAVTLAKQRLMTASFDYYDLRYPQEGLKGGFIYKTVPHVTLKSIANNPEIDEIYGRMHPAVEKALGDLNAALKGGKLRLKVAQGGRKGQTIDFAAADKMVELPSGDKAAANAILEWEVPFDLPEDWPAAARTPFKAFHAARQAMQKAMDASIAAHAEQETLYDQPQVAADKLRISGPFSVEAVPTPTVLSLDESQPAAEADTAIARSGETSRQANWRDELLKTGIRGKGGQVLEIAELETVPGLKFIHAMGTVAETGERILVSFGPEHAALEQRQVELALSEAEKLRPAPKFIVFCAFAFDPEAAKDIDEVRWQGVNLLKAHMNADMLTEDLKKARTSNQSFWLMGQPDVDLRKREDGLWEVEVGGFDYFDTKKGELISGGTKNIAVWYLDTDYDERSLLPHQVFFPMAGAKDGWNRLKKTVRAELDEDLLDAYHGTVSLPFEAGENRKVAVKIVDDRGIESLKILPIED